MLLCNLCVLCSETVRCIPKYIIWCVVAVSCVLAQDPVVNIPQGRIAGTKVYTENSLTPIEIFYGIPYANPPIGRYRFAAPERHAGWRKTFLAHRMRPRCPQVIDENTGENYNEDCLFLNIWTSRRADGKSMPVVVIFYSETWDRGGVTLPCEELAAEGLVVVTVAYRLGVLAFFTLRSLSARGNLALLDQYLALLWVRDNISAFGGDPSATTLIGHSAGADSILNHMVSPRSVGLFQRAILMAPRYIWKAVDEGRAVNATEMEQVSRKIAQSTGCMSEYDQEILHCMRDKPLFDIMSLYSRFNWNETLQPVPDNFLPISEQYLPVSLAMALSATKQPIMPIDLLLGATDLEDINHRDDHYLELLKRSPSQINEYANIERIPELLKMFLIYRTDSAPLLSQAIHWEYWRVKSNKDYGNKSLDAVEGLARMESSARWSVGNALLAARLARRISRLYVYRYLQPSVTDLHGHQLNYTGAVHGTDLIALLGDAFMLQIARRPATQEQKRISVKFRQYIVNFIKFGIPAVETVWQRYKVGDGYVHGIHDDITSQNVQNVNRDAAFWLQYLPQLYSISSSPVHTEQVASQQGENRLRGGVFAMCGVSAVLLLLLSISIIFLHRTRARRASIDIHR
ncbi:carboxylesterase 4A [Ostrinia furnacalis]|uniref:carboxylesterase 4A n=1 Tax=Ostrinia furnacalis TaxID=93504 RepID=UPI00103B6B46|nr:carboxylesterase 4A [Ostrinia furnacalis]